MQSERECGNQFPMRNNGSPQTNVILTTASIYYIINIGEMPAGKQSKSRRDSLLPDWGQIITIEYYRMDDTLSKEGYRGACIFDTGALSAPIS